MDEAPFSAREVVFTDRDPGVLELLQRGFVRAPRALGALFLARALLLQRPLQIRPRRRQFPRPPRPGARFLQQLTSLSAPPL